MRYRIRHTPWHGCFDFENKSLVPSLICASNLVRQSVVCFLLPAEEDVLSSHPPALEVNHFLEPKNDNIWWCFHTPKGVTDKCLIRRISMA